MSTDTLHRYREPEAPPLQIKIQKHRDGTLSLHGLDPMSIKLLTNGIRYSIGTMHSNTDPAIVESGHFLARHLFTPLSYAAKDIR